MLQTPETLPEDIQEQLGANLGNIATPETEQAQTFNYETPIIETPAPIVPDVTPLDFNVLRTRWDENQGETPPPSPRRDLNQAFADAADADWGHINAVDEHAELMSAIELHNEIAIAAHEVSMQAHNEARAIIRRAAIYRDTFLGYRPSIQGTVGTIAERLARTGRRIATTQITPNSVGLVRARTFVEDLIGGLTRNVRRRFQQSPTNTRRPFTRRGRGPRVAVCTPAPAPGTRLNPIEIQD